MNIRVLFKKYFAQLSTFCILLFLVACQNFGPMNPNTYANCAVNISNPAAMTECLKQAAVLDTLGKLIQDEVPIKGTQHQMYSQVANLPGGIFQPIPINLVSRNDADLVAPGDYELPAHFFCTQVYTSNGSGNRYTLARLGGKMSDVLPVLYQRASRSTVSDQDIQVLSWSIQAGVSYDELPENSRAIVDQLIPEFRDKMRGSFHEQLLRQWNMIAQQTSLPSLEQALGKLGDVGMVANNLLQARQTVLQQNFAYQPLANAFTQIANVNLPGGIQETPWSLVNNQVYMRFLAPEGAMHDGTIQFRVLPNGYQMGNNANQMLLAQASSNSQLAFGYGDVSQSLNGGISVRSLMIAATSSVGISESPNHQAPTPTPKPPKPQNCPPVSCPLSKCSGEQIPLIPVGCPPCPEPPPCKSHPPLPPPPQCPPIRCPASKCRGDQIPVAPVGCPPANCPELPDCPEPPTPLPTPFPHPGGQQPATSQPVNIFIGSAGDQNFNLQVKNYFNTRNWGGITARYFDWNAKLEAENYISTLPYTTTKINLIGHSFGADTAAQVAIDCADTLNTRTICAGRRINLLITVDPVTRIEIGLPATCQTVECERELKNNPPDPVRKYGLIRNSVNKWVDVMATNPGSLGVKSNYYIDIWGIRPKTVIPSTFIEVNQIHDRFTELLQGVQIDGSRAESAEQILRQENQ